MITTDEMVAREAGVSGLGQVRVGDLQGSWMSDRDGHAVA